MTQATKQIVKSRGLGEVEVSGIITVAADGTTTSTGKGWSAARTAEGVYKVTLTERYVSRVATIATAVSATGAWSAAEVASSVGNSATNYVSIGTFTAGAAADNDSGSIHFVIKLCDNDAR